MDDQTPAAVTYTCKDSTIRPFDTQNVLTWSHHFESVLRIPDITDKDIFDHLNAVLTQNTIAPIATQIKKTPEDESTRYDWLKGLLTDGHGKTPPYILDPR